MNETQQILLAVATTSIGIAVWFLKGVLAKFDRLTAIVNELKIDVELIKQSLKKDVEAVEKSVSQLKVLINEIFETLGNHEDKHHSIDKRVDKLENKS